jgi:hypothetical protein
MQRRPAGNPLVHDTQDAVDRGDRDSLERYYEQLSPEERRNRIILEPAYREIYNEVTQAHRTVDQPAYFWERWVPDLGPFASMLYMKLRQHCFYRPGSPDHREICWPRQETLAREIGLRDRGAIRRPLELLEKHGFIKREPSYRTDPQTRRPSRGTDRYLVYFELPLRPQEAAEVLIRHAHTTPLTLDLHVGAKPSHENGPPRGEPLLSPDPPTGEPQRGPSYPPKTPLHVVVKPPDEVIRGSHPQQLAEGPTPTSRWGSRPHISLAVPPPAELHVNEKKRSTFSRGRDRQMNSEAIEDLAFEIAEELRDPSSLRFYRLVAAKLPEPRIRMLLSETRSARAEGRITKSPGAYFTAAVKALAEELQIDLRLGTSRTGPGEKE